MLIAKMVAMLSRQAILYFIISAEKLKAEFISFQKKIFSFCLLLSAFCLLPTDESKCYLVVETIVQPGVSFNKDRFNISHGEFVHVGFQKLFLRFTQVGNIEYVLNFFVRSIPNN